MKRLAICTIILVALCANNVAGDYYYHHVWMSDTDNPTYPKPGALTDTLWESFSSWSDWDDSTPTLQIDPTADEVLAELSHYRNIVGQGDLFLFYYTGHGSTIEVQYAGTEGVGLLLDVPPGPSGTPLTIDTLTSPEYFGGFSQGATVVTVFDTCYAGQALAEPYGFNSTAGAVDDLNNMAALAAGTGDEEIGLYPQNYEMWPSGNWDYVSSYFTQGIIEGLQPGADGRPVADISQDGGLYADELFAYASWRMQEVGGSGGVFWNDIGADELPVAGGVPTPEPSTLFLFLSGSGSLIAFLRRRNRNHTMCEEKEA